MKTKILPILIIIASVSATVSAKDITTRKRIKVDRNRIERSVTSEMDTLRDEDFSAIDFAGFDKPLRSNYETVFVTNRSQHDLKGIIVECDYTDLTGRQLHKRALTVSCNIPAGQTRQIRFRTWDSQQAFFYRRSSKPRRADGTPFEVRCSCRGVIISKNQK